MRKYQLKPAAERDLKNIWLYSLERWGLVQADAYIDALDDCFQYLADNPQICPARMDFTPPVRLHNHLSHLIVYQQVEPGILILRVLHQTTDVPRHLADGDD